MAIPILQHYSRLVLAYTIGNSGVAWECSLCRKLFALTVDEAVERPRFTPPDHLMNEFRQHQCAVVLSRSFEMLQMNQEGRSRHGRR
jgi:hypothetical protein